MGADFPLTKTSRVPLAVPERWALVGNWVGSEPYTHGSTSYNYVLKSSPIPANLDTSGADQADKDYKESANITSTDTDGVEVISDFEFVLMEERLTDLKLQGMAHAACALKIRGDGTYTTYCKKVVFTILKRDSGGNDTSLATHTYTFDTTPSRSADSYGDVFSAYMHKAISTEQTISTTDTIVLRIEVFGYVSNASATDNKIRLYFSRGSWDTYVILPISSEVLP